MRPLCHLALLSTLILLQCHARTPARCMIKQFMTELTLTAMFEEVEEGGFIGYVAELPGANTQGETLEEVRENFAGDN